jgi:hypothetical protein
MNVMAFDTCSACSCDKGSPETVWWLIICSITGSFSLQNRGEIPEDESREERESQGGTERKTAENFQSKETEKFRTHHNLKNSGTALAASHSMLLVPATSLYGTSVRTCMSTSPNYFKITSIDDKQKTSL